MGPKLSAPTISALVLTPLLLALPHPAAAQTAPAQTVDAPSGVDGNRPPTFSAGPLDVNMLPVNMARIQRRLQQSRERTEHEGLNLRYIIDVYGRAPAIALFTPEENLKTGPVPWSAPSHQDMINQMTPKEYRAPAADFGALFRWLGDRAGK